MYQLLSAMKRIMEPPVQKRQPLMWRSAPLTQKIKAKLAAPVPTDEEMQYLTFFTTYCKQEDFTKYRSQFPDDFDLSFQPRRRSKSVESEVSELGEKVSSETSSDN